MTAIAYHASHEQFSPSHLLKLVVNAEKAGFEAIHSSDHFHPWSKRQGQSGFAFSWIAAALQATGLPFSMVSAPGQRYHPAIVAQAIATLAEMYPGRFNIELGSGEALNECITGQPWPNKLLRNERLKECVHIIRQLLAGEEVTHSGYVRVQEATLYTRPEIMPRLFGAALSVSTAQWAGSWADGLLTTAGDLMDTAAKIEAFRCNGGMGKPVYIQFAFSYARQKEEAIMGAWDQWRSNLLPSDKLASMRKPEDFDEASKNTTPGEVASKLPVFTTIADLKEKIEAYKNALNPECIILHNVNRYQEEFIADYASAGGAGSS